MKRKGTSTPRKKFRTKDQKGQRRRHLTSIKRKKKKTEQNE